MKRNVIKIIIILKVIFLVYLSGLELVSVLKTEPPFHQLLLSLVVVLFSFLGVLEVYLLLEVESAFVKAVPIVLPILFAGILYTESVLELGTFQICLFTFEIMSIIVLIVHFKKISAEGHFKQYIK